MSSYASYLLQSAGDRPAGYKRHVPLSQSGVADGCRLLVWTDCTVKCGVSRITASCKVNLERWRWAQQSGDEDGDAGGVSSYSLLQGHAKCMQPELKRADYWRKWKFKQKIENYWTEKLTSCPKSKESWHWVRKWDCPGCETVEQVGMCIVEELIIITQQLLLREIES